MHSCVHTARCHIMDGQCRVSIVDSFSELFPSKASFSVPSPYLAAHPENERSTFSILQRGYVPQRASPSLTRPPTQQDSLSLDYMVQRAAVVTSHEWSFRWASFVVRNKSLRTAETISVENQVVWFRKVGCICANVANLGWAHLCRRRSLPST